MLELFDRQGSLGTGQSELMGLQCWRRVPGALLCQGGAGSQAAAGLAVWTLGARAWGPFTTSLKVDHGFSSLHILSVYASKISDSLPMLYPSIFVLCSLHGMYFLPSCLCVQMLTNFFSCSS